MAHRGEGSGREVGEAVEAGRGVEVQRDDVGGVGLQPLDGKLILEKHLLTADNNSYAIANWYARFELMFEGVRCRWIYL